MINIIISIVELVLILVIAIIFNKIVKENKMLRERVKFLEDKTSNQSLTAESSNYSLLKTIEKIKSNYLIFKKDKIVILRWLVSNCSNDISILDKINTRKTFSKTTACDTIYKYCGPCGEKTNDKKIEAINAMFYLLNLYNISY